MADQTKPKFLFESKGVDKNTFHVVRFKGSEGLSSLYQFDLTLISDKADLDLGVILRNPALFTIKRDDGDIPFNGILSTFEQLHQMGGMVFYRAILVPRLWWATLSHHNQIFLNKNIQDFLSDVLKDSGMRQGLGFEFKLQGQYPIWEYLCQYDESHFNFLSRWMERDGLYYYFEQNAQGEKVIITDTHIAHSPMPEGTSLTYSPPSNLDAEHREEVVKNFMLKQQTLPQKVLLKDYNYRKPSLEMKAEAMISPMGMGEIYLYGEHFSTPEDGARLANIRAQDYLCRERLFHGVSTVPYMRTGYVFELKDHYRKDFNQRYLTTEVTHEGSQEAYLTAGLGLHIAKEEDRLYYRNAFTCIPATIQYRSQCNTRKPKFMGSMNARIDASGSGQYAELDSQGRYKVVLPLDTSGRSGGKATTWLRMAQPYAGSDHGMHFPLHKGTEVLLTCIDGDPDRPIIQSAVPNPETPSQVTDTNQTMCCITTGGQNRIHMEDQKGGERILMQTPQSNSWIRMGVPNDPPPSEENADESSGSGEGGAEGGGEKEQENEGIKLNTEADIKICGINLGTWVKGNEFKLVTGSSEEIIVGNDTKVFLIFKEDVVAGLETGLKMGGQLEFAPHHTLLHGEGLEVKAEMTRMRGEISDVTGEHAELAESVEQLTMAHTQLRTDHTTLTAQHNSLKGQTSKLAGQTSKLSGSVNKLAGDVSNLAGAQSELCGEVTKLTGFMTRSVGTNVAMIGLKTQSIGTKTTVSGETSEIAGEVNTIAGLINQI